MIVPLVIIRLHVLLPLQLYITAVPKAKDIASASITMGHWLPAIECQSLVATAADCTADDYQAMYV